MKDYLRPIDDDTAGKRCDVTPVFSNPEAFARLPAGSFLSNDAPFPPRYWWLKRIAVLIVIVVGALLLVGLWWGHVADRRYRALVDAAHARGEPILPEDFDAAPVPGSRNAGVALANASASLKLSQAFQDFANNYGDDNPPLTAGELELCRATVAGNSAALTLARKARSLPEVDWGVRTAKPALGTLLPYLNTQRELAKFLRWSIKLHHAQGDDAEAVEELRDMLSEAHAVEKGPGVLVGHMVGLGLTSMACAAVRENVTDLRIESGGGNPAAGTRPATRDQVRALIGELTDEARYRRDAVRAWQGERMMTLDSIVYFANGGKAVRMYPLFPVVVRPMVEIDAVRSAETIGDAIEAAGMANWPAGHAKLPRPRVYGGDSLVEDVTELYSRILMPSLDRALHQQFQGMTLRRVAALRLAIRMYQTDHQGTYPPSLEALVPAYLPALPADPFAPDGHPLRYVQSPAPAIYSVGDNGVDEGGNSAPNPSSGGSMLREWDGVDAVFPLEPKAPQTQPSTETHDHQ